MISTDIIYVYYMIWLFSRLITNSTRFLRYNSSKCWFQTHQTTHRLHFLLKHKAEAGSNSWGNAPAKNRGIVSCGHKLSKFTITQVQHQVTPKQLVHFFGHMEVSVLSGFSPQCHPWIQGWHQWILRARLGETSPNASFFLHGNQGGGPATESRLGIWM